MTVYDGDDFQFSAEWDGNTVRVYHLEVSPEFEGQGIGSAILETLKRVYSYEGAEKLVVRMGGGEDAEEFLERNGFEVLDIEEDVDGRYIRGDYIVKAVYEYPDIPTMKENNTDERKTTHETNKV
jgi:ribosomal protein S18 acetylase RimI-like enzyme